MDLSDTQSILLCAASQRDDLLIQLPERLKGSAARKAVDGLLIRGLAEETVVSRNSPSWREENGEAVGLRVTPAGLAALGLGDDIGVPSAAISPGAPERQVVNGASPALESLAIVHVADTDRTTAPQPRAGSKQGQLIILLSRDDGASIVEIATALGWLPHTTRAALTGLRHKGYELAREISSDRGSLYRITALPIMTPAMADAAQAEAA